MVKVPQDTNESQINCEICNKAFKEKHKLKRHMMIHTGERPFQCLACKKQFSLEYNLRTHFRVHTGEKPFQCNHPGCEKSFTQSGNLKTHFLSKHSESAKMELKEESSEYTQQKSFESIICQALSRV